MHGRSGETADLGVSAVSLSRRGSRREERAEDRPELGEIAYPDHARSIKGDSQEPDRRATQDEGRALEELLADLQHETTRSARIRRINNAQTDSGGLDLVSGAHDVVNRQIRSQVGDVPRLGG